MFQHGGVSRFFTDRWMSLYKAENQQFSEHNISDSHTPFNYGRTNIYEDMATFVQYMFSRDGWAELRRWEKENSFYAQKLILIRRFIEEVSDGEMDEKYFAQIENGVLAF